MEPQSRFTNNSTKKLKNMSPWSLILEPSVDLGGLYLGNLDNARDEEFFESEKISAVLNLAGFKCDNPVIAETKILQVEDYPDFDLTVYYQECFDFIHKYRTEGKNVFVHCAAGKSRSPAIVMGYLMKTMDMDLWAATYHVESRRSIKPNHGFIEQLRGYEQTLRDEKRALMLEQEKRLKEQTAEQERVEKLET